MNDWLIAPVTGGIVVLIGAGLMISHALAWRRQRSDPEADQSKLWRFRARYRRRMQASGLIVLLGLMIPVGDLLFLLEQPLVSTAYWIAVLLLTAWLVLLGLGDFVTTSAHSRAELSRLHEKQRELEHQLSQLRDRGSNGQKPRS